MKNIEEIAPGLKDSGQPLEDVATAGQPEEEQFERLAEAGYKTVVDMRVPEEDRGLDEPEAVRRAGMEHVNIPIGHEDVDDETFGRFRELMTDPEHRPALVHCSSANKVGGPPDPLPGLGRGGEHRRGGEGGLQYGPTERRTEAGCLQVREREARGVASKATVRR